MINRTLQLFLLLLYFQPAFDLFPQSRFGYGVLLDSALYVNAPVKAPLMRGDYNNLPPSYSLKKYCPTPGNQGEDGTCAAWSTAYAGRTILEAINKGLSGKNIDKNSFSPSFVYNQIRTGSNCTGGISLLDALNVLKDQGGVKYNDFGYSCEKKVTSADREKAFNHRIIEYREIANKYEGNQTLFAKKSISENKPVIIAMDCPDSFQSTGEIWNPGKGDYKSWSQGHGIAVIGYDDSKAGGAFEVINSWGKDWGKNGFAWIRYSDFDYFALLAFELIDVPPPNNLKPDLSGKVIFRESTGNTMKMSFNGEYFTTVNAYQSGTLFELFVSNDQPAYVYAFSTDSTFKINKIFPFHNNMVAYLPYTQNNVAIPSEDSYNMLDDITGKTYYCFLYSGKELQIDEKISALEKASGTFWERIKKVFGSVLIPPGETTYTYANEISFSAFGNRKAIIPVLIEIKHE